MEGIDPRFITGYVIIGFFVGAWFACKELMENEKEHRILLKFVYRMVVWPIVLFVVATKH